MAGSAVTRHTLIDLRERLLTGGPGSDSAAGIYHKPEDGAV